jgi:hypothetical protein
LEVVAICDHLGLLGGIKPEHEIAREPIRIALDLLVQPLGRHAVEHGQMGIDHHAQLAHDDDAALDARQQRQRGGVG